MGLGFYLGLLIAMTVKAGGADSTDEEREAGVQKGGDCATVLE
jgi:hypothetical protein